MNTSAPATPARLASALRGLYRLGRAHILGIGGQGTGDGGRGEDLTRLAKAQAVKPGAGGKLASSRSKTGDPKCSAAVSAWKTGSATPQTHKTLAECRAMAKGKKLGERQRAAGNEAKAQATEHRAGKGETVKARGEKASELITQRKARTSAIAAHAEPAAVAPTPKPTKPLQRGHAPKPSTSERPKIPGPLPAAQQPLTAGQPPTEAESLGRVLSEHDAEAALTRRQADAAWEAHDGTPESQRLVQQTERKAQNAQGLADQARQTVGRQHSVKATVKNLVERSRQGVQQASELAAQRKARAAATAAHAEPAEPAAPPAPVEQPKLAEPALEPAAPPAPEPRTKDQGPRTKDRSIPAARARIEARIAAARKAKAKAVPGSPEAEQAKRTVDRSKGRDVQAAQIVNSEKGAAGFSKIKALRERRAAAAQAMATVAVPAAPPPGPALAPVAPASAPLAVDDLGLNVTPADEAAWQAAIAAPSPTPNRLPSGPVRRPMEHEIGGVAGAGISPYTRTPADHIAQLRSVQQAIADGDPRVTPAEIDRHLGQLGKLSAGQLMGVARDFHGRSNGIGVNKGQILERIGQKLHGDLQQNQAGTAPLPPGFAANLATATDPDDILLAPVHGGQGTGDGGRETGKDTDPPSEFSAPVPRLPSPVPPASSLYAQAAARQAAERARTAQPYQPRSTPEVHARVEQAFAAADKSRGGQNWVSMADLRKGIGGTREEQDAAIHDLRRADKLSLDSHEGMSGPLTDEQRAAVLEDAGGRLAWASRRDPAWGTGQPPAAPAPAAPAPIPQSIPPRPESGQQGRAIADARAAAERRIESAKRRAAAQQPPVAPAPSPGAHPATSLSPHDFAAKVHAIGQGVGAEGRFAGSNKVFIGDLHRAAQQDPALAGLSLDQFKAKLTEANQARTLDLSRADLVEAMDPKKVAESNTHHFGSTFNFLNLPRAAGSNPAATQAPTPAPRSAPPNSGLQGRAIADARAAAERRIESAKRREAGQPSTLPGAQTAPTPVPAIPNPDAHPALALSHQDFAAKVHAAGARVGKQGRFGDNKVFIGDLHRAAQQDPALAGISLPAFKAKLAEGNQARTLDLARADLVEAMDPKQVAESNTHHFGATYNFLRLPEAGEKAVTSPAPNPAQRSAPPATPRPAPTATAGTSPHDQARSVQNRLLNARPEKPPHTPAERQLDQHRRDAMAQAQRVLQAGSDRFTADPQDVERLDRLVATYDQAAKALQEQQAKSPLDLHREKEAKRHVGTVAEEAEKARKARASRSSGYDRFNDEPNIPGKGYMGR